jgi:glycosyltransferase involved in cell wall biosynthesis
MSHTDTLLAGRGHQQTGGGLPADRSVISVVVLTFNEGPNLADCLASVRDLALEVFIVDSGSTDETLAIAAEYGAVVYTHAFESHSKQWSWAISHLPIRGKWVLGLDADQRVTPELARELESVHGEAWRDVVGVYLNRKQIFRGSWIRHGGYYPKYLLKLFRPAAVFTDENDLVDHHFHVRGETRKLRHDLLEANLKEDDISFWIEKHNRYALKLAKEEWMRRRGERPDPIEASLGGNPDQRTLQMKRMWVHIPLYVRPFLYFTYRYFFQLGFLDGKQGAIFHFMHAFWYRLLIDIHLDDMLHGKLHEKTGAAK